MEIDTIIIRWEQNITSKEYVHKMNLNNGDLVQVVHGDGKRPLCIVHEIVGNVAYVVPQVLKMAIQA